MVNSIRAIAEMTDMYDFKLYVPFARARMSKLIRCYYRDPRNRTLKTKQTKPFRHPLHQHH